MLEVKSMHGVADHDEPLRLLRLERLDADGDGSLAGADRGRDLGRGRCDPGPPGHTERKPEESPSDILKERLAVGEISQREYVEQPRLDNDTSRAAME